MRRFGTIEFVHTRRKAVDLAGELSYDTRYGLWRASLSLALTDMKYTGRDTGLINPESINELI
jgi:hypothetical protein